MITPQGYSKDPSIKPEAIVVTWGKDMIEEKGGLLSFIRYFEKHMSSEQGLWLNKCAKKPKYDDLIYVYIIVNNRLRYKCFYGGYESGEAEITNGDGHSWSSSQRIWWPRIILAGPLEKAPFKRTLRGFQGFRYATILF